MKSVRTIFIISGLIAVLSIGVVVFMMFWGPEPIEFEGKSIPELLESGELVPLIVVPVVLIISGLAILPFIRIIFPAQIKNGVTAQAKVLKVWDTGVSINDNPQVGLLLAVSPPGGNPFQVEAKTVVSRLNVALVQPGTTAEVIFDPLKPKRLQVLTLNIQGIDSPDTAARLEELISLRDRGLITEEEYRQKRQEILDSL